MSAARRSACLGLALAAAGCASPPQLSRFDLVGWHELRSDQVEIVGDVPEPVLRRLSDDIALFVAVVALATNASTSAPRSPTRIFALSNDAMRLMRVRGIEGFMARLLDGHLAMVNLEGGHSAAARQVFFHEYAHFLLSKGPAVDYPLWYNEGFADLLSTIRRRENSVELGSPPSARVLAVARRGRVDLRSIFEPRTYEEVEDIGDFYAGAWAVVHYLSASEERGARLQRFLELLVRGVPWSDAYPQAFDVPIDVLSRRVLEHALGLAGGAPFVLMALDARPLGVERIDEVRALPPAQTARALGEFWLRLADLEEDGGESVALGRAFFERSLALDPREARAHAGLALCRALGGDLAGARAVAGRALALAPEDARVRVLVAETDAVRSRTLDERGDALGAADARRAAREEFLRAIELAPEDPVAWAGFGASFGAGDGDLQPGIAALERALELGAWAARPNLELARLYTAAGQIARARERLEEVARIDEGPAGERAAELLAELGALDGGPASAAQ